MNSGPERSSTFSATKPRCPTTRPRRTRKICTDASSGSSARPTTSKSSERSDTICCVSAALCTAVIRSRRRAARSNANASEARQHLGLQARQDRLGVAGEEPHQVLDVAVVRLVVDGADARSRAAVDVEEQARPAQALVPDELGVRARADREAPDEEVERLADGVGVPVGAEVAHALALAPPDDGRTGPLLVQRDGEPGVALVVLQPDVVAGQVILDQRVLEDQRVDLGVDDHPLDVVGLGHHLGRAGHELGRVLPVIGQAVAQGLGLAHVEDPALGVEKLVDARGVGDRAGRAACPASIPLSRSAETGRYNGGAGLVSGTQPRIEADIPADGRPGCPRRPYRCSPAKGA